MLTNAQVKQIRALQQKKFRYELREYLIQGEKIVLEALQSETKPKLIIGNQAWINAHESVLKSSDFVIANEKQLSQISSLKTPAPVVAIMPMEKATQFSFDDFNGELVLILDYVQDPGNFGTILRIADWYGVRHIICSENSVDYTNPKVIQSTMGAFLRVKIHYHNLRTFILDYKSHFPDYPILGSFMDGENMLNLQPISSGILIMGNEGQGISAEIEKLCTSRIAIPGFPDDNHEMESLNVATATAILISELRKPFQGAGVRS
ncbi:MAG: RNA methyltransferase [Bacteroidales bacterium]|jgi:TrmH family RNA methyltransferase|nr:RNA methyltransferase [Bacteroidales bacterium]